MFDTLIVEPIMNALMLLYSIVPGGDFGVAVIIFTIIIRFALYPIVRKQLHQTRVMRKLQPELKEIKKAAGGNKQLEVSQQMELYKRYGVSPFRSIGILLIQLPIFFGLYRVIRIIALERDQVAHYIYEPFRHIGPIEQIINDPSSFNHHLLGFLDLTKTAFGDHGIDLTLLALALVSAITQYVISRQLAPSDKQPPKKFRQIMADAAEGKQADSGEMSQMMMGKMTKIMPIFMFFIMVSLPGAIALYYTVSNLVAAGQQAYLLKQESDDLSEIAERALAREEAKKSRLSKTSKSDPKKRQQKAREGKVVVTKIKAKE